MLKDTENQQQPQSRAEQFKSSITSKLRGVDRFVRVNAAFAVAGLPFAGNIQKDYSANTQETDIAPIIQQEIKDSNLPEQVVTTKDIHPVTSPVALIPDKSITIPAGTSLPVIKRQVASYQVLYKGELLNINPADVEVVEAQPPAEAPISIETRETTAAVNRRSGPGTNFDALGVIPENTEVIILQDNGTGWAKVKIEGNDEEYYLSTDFLDNQQITQIPPVETVQATTSITEVAPITATETVTSTTATSDTVILHPEAIGGQIEDENLLAEAQEALGAEAVKVMSTANDLPVALDSKAKIIGTYKNSKWEEYKFPKDIRVSQASLALEEVQKLFPNAKDAKFSVGVIYIQDKNSKDFARVENGKIILELEESLIKFINRDPNLKPNLDLDSIIVKIINGTPIAEVNNAYFVYSPNGWLFTTPDIEAQLNVAPLPIVSEQDSGEYIVQPDEINVTLDQGYDFEGRATLDENAEQVVLEWLAEAFAKSGVLSPIMGSTKEDVLAYLKANNYQLPPQAKLPSQLPRVFADVSTHNYVKFISPEFPINLNEIKLQFVWNDEIDKYKDYEQYLVWSGNNPGFFGCGMFVDNDGKLHIIAIVERDDFYDDPVKLESAATKGVYRAIAMMAHFQGEELAGGDEYAFISAFREADSLPKNLINTIYQIIAAKTP